MASPSPSPPPWSKQSKPNIHVKDFKAPTKRLPPSIQKTLGVASASTNADSMGEAYIEGKSMAWELALARLIIDQQERAKTYPPMDAHLFFHYPISISNFKSKLHLTINKGKTDISLPLHLPSVIIVPLNPEADLNAGLAHDHSVCIAKRQNKIEYWCPSERGNHFVVLVIDNRSYVQKVLQAEHHLTKNGLITYWDPLGHVLQDVELKRLLGLCYPGYALVSLPHRLQNDGFQCPMWTYLFIMIYARYVNDPPPAPKQRLCDVFYLQSADNKGASNTAQLFDLNACSSAAALEACDRANRDFITRFRAAQEKQLRLHSVQNLSSLMESVVDESGRFCSIDELLRAL